MKILTHSDIIVLQEYHSLKKDVIAAACCVVFLAILAILVLSC